jgi:hypothetical protein
MVDGARGVKMSSDQRQALCYQCHAPTSTRQVASGDDRTGVGVHEGISCLGCHSQHGLTAQLTVAEISGIQSQGIMAQVKHLAGYNGSDNVVIDERTLHETSGGSRRKARCCSRTMAAPCPFPHRSRRHWP